jgi:hypothetical protein
MEEVQRQLRSILGLSDDCDAFGALVLQWYAHRSRSLSLVWISRGQRHVLDHPEYQAEIEPVGLSMALRFYWSPRACRILAHGSVDQLKAFLADTIQAGGPYGGPETHLSGNRGITTWEGPALMDRAWSYSYGAGYQARVRPLGIRPIAEQHCLILVSPAGSFRLDHFGLHLDLAGVARGYQGADDVSESDFRDASWPWHIRIRGVRHRLLYALRPGLVGYRVTEVGEVYLCLLGVNDLALILVASGLAPRCLARGGVTELNGWELLPGETRTFDVPAACNDPFTTAESLDELIQLAPPVRQHLMALTSIASKVPGSREVRRLIWAVCNAHEKGNRENFRASDEEIYNRLIAGGFINKAPQERVRRSALHWLSEHTPLVKQSFYLRRRVWTIRMEWLANPTKECIEAMAASGLLTRRPSHVRSPRG